MQHETAFKWQGHQISVTDENIWNAAAENFSHSKSLQFHWVKIKFCKSGTHSDVAVFQALSLSGWSLGSLLTRLMELMAAVKRWIWRNLPRPLLHILHPRKSFETARVVWGKARFLAREEGGSLLFMNIFSWQWLLEDYNGHLVINEDGIEYGVDTDEDDTNLKSSS